MNRKELYKEIVNLNLQEEIKSIYGCNYTNCTNAELSKVVDRCLKSLKTLTNNSKCDCCDDRFSRLVEILAKKNILLKSEVNKILK